MSWMTNAMFGLCAATYILVCIMHYKGGKQMKEISEMMERCDKALRLIRRESRSRDE